MLRDHYPPVFNTFAFFRVISLLFFFGVIIKNGKARFVYNPIMPPAKRK